MIILLSSKGLWMYRRIKWNNNMRRALPVQEASIGDVPVAEPLLLFQVLVL